MPLSPISFIAVNYRDFKTWWLKAYDPGTTTPKSMALDSEGLTTVAKLQLNADGFLIASGGALVIPYLNGAYDLWLFPTEAEADANDTSNALRLADDILGVLPDDAIETLLINDLSQAYEFATRQLMIDSLIVFPPGKKLHAIDTNSDYIVTTGATAYPIVSPALAFGYAAIQPFLSKVSLIQAGGLAGSGNDATLPLVELKTYCEINNITMVLDAKEFRVTEEINFDAEIRIESSPANSIDNIGETGTTILVDVNDVAKVGFNFGKNNNVMSPYFQGCKFKAVSPCSNTMTIQCATFYGDHFIFDANSNQYNGLFIENWFIGNIRRVEGKGKVYFLKVTGNTSGVIEHVNAQSVEDVVGSHSIQIDSLVDGFFRIENLYLEAQTRRNLSITNCQDTATILIDKIYEETQTYPIIIDNCNSVQILQYRTNLSDEGIHVSNSKGINIGVLAIGKFERNPAVKVLDDSDVSVSTLQNNFVNGADKRDYTIIEGELSGSPILSSSANVKLLPSAGKSVIPYSAGAVSATVPTNPNQAVSDTSCLLTAGQNLKIPISSWKKGKRYVIKLVYKNDNAGQNDCYLRIVNGSTIKDFLSFNNTDTGFRTLYFVFEAPEVNIDGLTALYFYNTNGTAIVHYLGMAEYGGDYLPNTIEENEIHLTKEIDLAVLGVQAITDSVEGLKFSRFELQYDGASTAGATVFVGRLPNAGGLTKYVEFASSIKVVGDLETAMTVTVGSKDMSNAEKGLGLNIAGTGTGKAIVHVYAKLADPSAT